jgi:uncharacterized membrane protein YphA (DoxX/SURF4 family)
MKAIVVTDQAAGTAEMKLVERPEPQAARLASLSGASPEVAADAQTYAELEARVLAEMQHSFKWQQVCAWLLRVGLAAAFLSAVADRFGLWGQPGSRGVSWGDMAHFYDYTAEVNAFLPSTLIPAVAWLATIAETGLGFALLSGVCRRPVALATGVLLTLFALAMSISLGVNSALAYSVPTAAAAALLLATTDRPRCRACCGPTTHR